MKTTDWGNMEESKLGECNFMSTDIVAALEFGR